jgi:ankyrin repeat protein
VKSQREDDPRSAKGVAQGRAGANDEPKGDPNAAMELYAAAGNYIMSAFEAVLSRNPIIDGMDPTRIPLAAAARTCRPDVAKLLLAKGADPNAPLTNWMAKHFPRSNPDAVTPLMKAAEFGCLDVASILLEHGADVNLTKPSQALVIAARKEKEVMARFLLDHGANPDLFGEYGGTALVEAASIPNDPIVELLLGRKASIDAPDRKGFTAVMGAAVEAHLATVDLLLSKGANSNLSNANGETALMLTTKNTAIVRTLLEHGADPKPTDHKGRTALMRAVDSEASPDAIELLLSRGAPVNARDQLGMTALDYAYPHQDTHSGQQVVAILKSAGAVE